VESVLQILIPINSVADVCVSTLQKENGLSYQYQTWYTYSLAVARHALTQRWKGEGHMVINTTVVWLLVAAVAILLLLLAWDCTSY